MFQQLVEKKLNQTKTRRTTYRGDLVDMPLRKNNKNNTAAEKDESL